MNEKTGPLNIEVMKNIGRNLSTDILDSCKDIVNNIEIQTMELLTQHKRHLIKIANSLLKNETINYKEIKSLVPKKIGKFCRNYWAAAKKKRLRFPPLGVLFHLVLTKERPF